MQLASVLVKVASTPMPICIRGNIPHLGAINSGCASNVAHVSPGEAEVHAKYKSVISNDSPQLMVIVVLPEVAGKKLSEFFWIGPAHAKMAVPVPISTPFAPYLCKVPHNAKDVRVEPVLFLIPNTNVLVPLQLHRSLEGAGSVALINSKSFDVQELAEGNVCADAFMETRAKKIKQKTFKECNK